MSRSAVLFLAVAACESSSPSGLSASLPRVPAPDGTPQSVFAGRVASPAELIDGPASSGMVGDYFIRNDRARFVIQSEARVIGVVPWGGNLVDAVPVPSTVGDQLGEVSMIYVLGRTCAHERVEVIQDGSRGGVAAIRATGKSGVNDFINLRGMGIINVPVEVDPDIDDPVECATTYILRPGSDTLEVSWTLYNPGEVAIEGPLGALNDTGGEVQVFSRGRGFSHLQGGFEEVLEDDSSKTTFYAVYQGPGVSYGILPHLDDPEKGAAGLVIAGAAVMVFGATNFIDIGNRDKDYLHLEPKGALTVTVDVTVGTDGGATERRFLESRGVTTGTVAGTVTWAGTRRPRVSIYEDADGNGAIGDADFPLTYFDADSSGAFTGTLAPGSYLARADVPDVARSAVSAITVTAGAETTLSLTLPAPGSFTYTVTDGDTGEALPVKLTVVGVHPAPLEKGHIATHDRYPGVVRQIFSPHGTSVGTGADPILELPAGGPYRVYASHGPEWSIDSFDIASVTAGATGTFELALYRVVDTTGYVATGFHQHSLGSPDSPVGYDDRVTSLAVEGIEFFATTEHDYLKDLDPNIDALGLRGWTDAVVGVETTPFAYGHFIGYPMSLSEDDASHGAVDWAKSATEGFAMLPPEIWDGLRGRGAEVVQVCHPRGSGFSAFQAYFDRAGLTFNFEERTITGEEDRQEVPSDWLRLPLEQTLYSNEFDALETWINFDQRDSDGDGVMEYASLDRVLRDLMNFSSFGKLVSPVGNADTHTLELDAAGLPRTLIAVPDDSPTAITTGLDQDVWDTLLGATPRDMVVTNGPFLRVTDASGASLLGRTVLSVDEPVELNVTAITPGWMEIDTIEVFSNETYEPRTNAVTSLIPLLCYTTRPPGELHENDPCRNARMGGAQTLTVEEIDPGVNGLHLRREARVVVSLSAADIVTRAGATGSDAWVIVRVRGRRSLFPMLVDGALEGANLAVATSGDRAAIAAAMQSVGSFPLAYTAPVLIDFDGGGWRAPFAP
jgi:hypothetical protein